MDNKLNVRIMFDNAGGISADFNGFKFFYQSPKQVAEDYEQFLKDNGDNEDWNWENSDENIIIYDGTDKNGGHKTVNKEEIEELINGRDDYYWGYNEQYFIEELRKIRLKKDYDNCLTLKELRSIRNIQQKFMLEKLGLSQNGYKAKESGEREFYVSELEMLCDIFGKSEKDMIKIIKNSKEK